MLVNLSPHPFLSWDLSQRQAAVARFGTVIDVLCPMVPPEATADDVAALVTVVRGLVDRIFEAFADGQPDEEILDSHDGVHLMGETSFVVEFALQWTSGEQPEPLYCSILTGGIETPPDGNAHPARTFVQFRPMGTLAPKEDP